jgi:hypothetical protein
MSSLAWPSLLVMCGVLSAAGCGDSGLPKTVPVKGKVTYRGRPVTSGLVMLTPSGSGHAATGSLAADGSFELTTFVKNDGAVPGSYQVAVQVFPEEGAGLPGAEFGGKPPPIPLKFGSATTSGLTAEIKDEKDQTLDLVLKD